MFYCAASKALNLCIVRGENPQLFRPKMRQYFLRINLEKTGKRAMYKAVNWIQFQVGYQSAQLCQKILPMKMVLQPGGLSLRVGVGAFGVGGYSTLFMYTAINTGIEISVF